MEALSVGMYVRYKPLLSSKYVKINKIKEIEEKENCLHIWLEDKELITEKYLIKASYNIIDILEEGDYVNGCYIQEIKSLKDNVMVCMLDSDYEFTSTITNKDIKTIVTKEQFEQMAYKVGE